MSENTTGIEPTEFNVLVRLDRTSGKIGSLYVPDEKKDRDQALNIYGTLVAVSPLAFTYDDWKGVDEHHIPKVGERVIIAKGAGLYITDKESPDGEFYRLIKDKDVAAIVRTPKKASKAA